MSEFHFIRPYWLLALLPYLVLLGLMLRNKLGQGDWAQVCDPELLPYLLQDKPTQSRRWPQFGFSLAALLCIFALAGPTWERLPAPVLRNTAALVIALDLSRSMDAEDIKPSRLIRARYKIADILKRRKDGQTALLVYTDEAFTVTPLTDDTQTIDSQLSALNTNIMPGSGSDAAVALQKAVELLKQAGAQQGDILLVTDGAEGDAELDAAKRLGSYQLSILAVGTAAGAPIPVNSESGAELLKDAQGNIVIPKLMVEPLRRLADAGGGLLQLLRDDDADVESLQKLFERRTQAQADADKGAERLMDQWQDRGAWLLLPVLPLAALLFRRGVLVVALLLILPLPKTANAFSWQDIWQTPDQQGQQAFNTQRYEQAAEQFKDPRWKAAAEYKAGKYEQALETLKEPQTADDLYNRGNALAKLERYQEAIDAYQKALQANPGEKDREDIENNKQWAEKKLQEQQQKQQQDQQQSRQQQDQQDKNKQAQQDKQQGNQEQQPQQGGQQQNNEQQEQPEQQQPSADKTEQQQKQAETQPAEAEQQAQERQTDEKAQAAQGKPEQDDVDKAEQAQQAMTAQPQVPNEQRQADEQWLKRIPDDPSGLLRRKFAYQYGQRQRHQPRGDQQW